MRLDEERMFGYGPYKVDEFQVNFLYGLNDLCKKYVTDRRMKILELGGNDGVSTNLFSQYSDYVTCVDIIQTVKMRSLLNSNNKIKFYNMRFQDFFQNLNQKFDLIYIDGDHSYESAFRDINQSLPYIVDGGFISGHDYNSMTPGVIEAVNKIFKSNDVEVYSDSSWIIKIKFNNEL